MDSVSQRTGRQGKGPDSIDQKVLSVVQTGHQNVLCWPPPHWSGYGPARAKVSLHFQLSFDRLWALGLRTGPDPEILPSPPPPPPQKVAAGLHWRVREAESWKQIAEQNSAASEHPGAVFFAAAKSQGRRVWVVVRQNKKHRHLLLRDRTPFQTRTRKGTFRGQTLHLVPAEQKTRSAMIGTETSHSPGRAAVRHAEKQFG